MSMTSRMRAHALAAVATLAAYPDMAAPAAEEAPALRVAAGSEPLLRSWDARIARMLHAGELRARQVREDRMLTGRIHERLRQMHAGVPVWGGEVVRQRAVFTEK